MFEPLNFYIIKILRKYNYCTIEGTKWMTKMKYLKFRVPQEKYHLDL